MSKPLDFRTLVRRGACLALILNLLAAAGTASAQTVNLGSAADYAVIGVGGAVNVQSDFKLYQSATKINGNVAGGAPHTTVSHGIDATVNGKWDYDLTNADPSASGYTGSVTGGFHQVNLAGLAADARAASAQAAAFAPSQVFSSLSEGQTITGGAGLNVIQITGDSTIKTSLTLSGTSSSTFVLQFTSPTTAGHDVLTLSGMNMNLLGGVQAGNIFWNFNGTGGDVTITSMAPGQKVFGTFLAPDRNLTADHAIVDGRLIAGGSGSLLNIHSSSEINAVPEVGASTLFLVGIGLLAAARLFRRQSA